MIKQPFFSRIQQELCKNNPNINNLLYTGKPNGQQQQFNEFVLKHLHKFITNHKYYGEIRDTLAKNITKNHLSIQSQNNKSQEKQSAQNNQIRVYVTNLLKSDKQLKQYKQCIDKAQQNLNQLSHIKFEAGQAFQKKIRKLVLLLNTYQSFLSNFTSLSLNSQQQWQESERKWSVNSLQNEFIQNKFMQSMSTIHLYVTDYLGGIDVIKKYSISLSQLQIKIQCGLNHNMEILCKNMIKNRQQIKDAVLVIKQMIKGIRQRQMFAEFINKHSSAIEVQLAQLKKQINILIKSANHDRGYGFGYNIFYHFFRPHYVNLIDQLYNQLPYTKFGATLNDKINAISQRINDCNLSMEIIQKYSSALNTLVHKCLMYFEIERQEDVLQPQYTFSLKDIQNIEKIINIRIQQQRQKSVHKQRKIKQADIGPIPSSRNGFSQSVNNQLQLEFEDLSKQYSVELQEDTYNDQKYHQKNIQLQSKQDQIIKLSAHCQQIEKELIKLRKENSELLKLVQQQKDQKQLKNNQALQYFEQLQQQISRLKSENQTYIKEKMALINEIDLQKERNQQQLQSLLKKKEMDMKQLQKKIIQEKQQILKRICDQHQVQKKKLKAQIWKIQQQYLNFKNKYYEQLEQSYNQSIQRYSNNKSKEQQPCNNKSMILEEEDSREELNQIIRLQKQSEQKFLDQIQQLKKKMSIIANQLQGTKKEKEAAQRQLVSKQTQMKLLKDQIKKQQQARTLSQSKLKSTFQDLQKSKKTLRDLQQTIQNQKKEREQKRQTQFKINQQHQFSSNLPTLVHYNRQLFNIDIFDNNEQDKKNLVDHLEWYARSRIKQTKLVYKFDPKNKINFHHYIDQIQCLTMVIKTKHAIIAGFYPGVYREKQVLNKGGLLVSVTNNNSYLMYQRKKDTKTIYRGMIYDTFFAIYGNAQIRIKTGFKTVFSNFGVSNGYYNNRGDKVDKLLNEGEKREVQFQLCEFYQVCFEKQDPNFR